MRYIVLLRRYGTEMPVFAQFGSYKKAMSARMEMACRGDEILLMLTKRQFKKEIKAFEKETGEKLPINWAE